MSCLKWRTDCQFWFFLYCLSCIFNFDMFWNDNVFSCLLDFKMDERDSMSCLLLVWMFRVNHHVLCCLMSVYGIERCIQLVGLSHCFLFSLKCLCALLLNGIIFWNTTLETFDWNWTVLVSLNWLFLYMLPWFSHLFMLLRVSFLIMSYLSGFKWLILKYLWCLWVVKITHYVNEMYLLSLKWTWGEFPICLPHWLMRIIWNVTCFVFSFFWLTKSLLFMASMELLLLYGMLEWIFLSIVNVWYLLYNSDPLFLFLRNNLLSLFLLLVYLSTIVAGITYVLEWVLVH